MTKLKILFLEDNPQDAFLVQRTLEQSGIEFDHVLVSTEKDFCAALQHPDYDAILLDNELPQFNAAKALEILNEKQINIPSILVSGSVSENIALQVIQDGAWDCVSKDRLYRLPVTILNAVNKHRLEIEYKKKTDDIIRQEAIMKEAERLAHIGSWENNISEKQYYWSDEYYRILGYKVGEVTPCKDHLLARIHPDDVAYVSQRMREAKANASSAKYTYRVIPKDGTVKFVESEVFITRNDRNEIVRINGFAKDITDSELAERELIKTETKYRNVFERNPVPMWVMEEGSFRLVDVNNAALQHYGYTRDEFLTMTALDIRQPDEQRRFQTEKPFTKAGDIGLWEHRKKDGTIIVAQVTIDKILIEDRKCVLILANDVTRKTASEKKLRHTMLRLKQAQSIAHIGSWDLDLSTGVSIWSEEACKIYGLSPGDNIQSYESWLSYIHPDDTDAIVSKIAESNATLKGSDFDHRIVRRDGTIRHIHSQYEFEVINGQPIGLYGISHDVTETKISEDKLKHTALRLQQAQGIAHIGSWEHDLRTDKLVWSDEAHRIYGLDPANGITSFQDWKMFIHPEDFDQVMGWIKKSAESVSSIALNYRIVRLDGAVRHIYAQFEHEFNGDRKAIGRYGIMHDITEMKEAEQALVQSEANLRLIMDSIPQSISVRNLAGEFVFVNKRLAELYGTSPEKLIGQSIRSVIPKENNDEEFLNRDGEIIRTGQTRIIPDLNFTDSTGCKRAFHITKVPYILAGTNVKAVLGIGTEITHQKQAEAERMKMMSDLVQRNKDLEQFSYIVSHSLRAPVANILGITGLIKSGDLADDEFEFLLDGLTESVKKLDDVVMDLNEITQLSHTISEFKEEVKFAELLTDVEEGISNLICKYDVSINADFREVTTLHTVHKYMHSIFHNLITNSIKYKKDGKALVCDIRSKKNGNCIELFFKDNGTGLDLSKTGDQIFDLYKRYHLGMNGNKNMGLFMVKTQVEDLGGQISVTSEINSGTEFKIILPLLDAVA